VPLISNLDALDEVTGISFGDRASVMPWNWTRTPVAYTSHCNTFNGVMLGRDVDNFPPVGGSVA
jgi:hypothetical protein